MKNRFSTLDLLAIIPELSQKLKGMRVSQVYDVDHKTYLFKLSKTAAEAKNQEGSKDVLLIESGIRIHSTEFEWPKSQMPSGFTMKLRKHLNNKRLEHIRQLGIDRVVDIQFGSDEAAYHVIVELYDRGNILITDYTFTILNILRPRQAGTDEDVKLVVRQKYPVESAKQEHHFNFDVEKLKQVIANAKNGDHLKKILNPHVYFGAPLIEHSLIEAEVGDGLRLKKENVQLDKIEKALEIGRQVIKSVAECQRGYIIQKVEKRIGGSGEEVVTFIEFHPVLFHQHKSGDNKTSYLEMESFDKCVDVFYSNIEGQKIDSKALSLEKEAMKKLENVKKDHQKRLDELARLQEEDVNKAKLIEMNIDLVEKALLVIRSAIANQFSWKDIREMIEEAQAQEDEVAKSITGLNLNKNTFLMKLFDLYSDAEQNWGTVEIDIDLTAFANARKFYDKKRQAAKKEQKTIDASTKAFKNAEKKTFQALKEVAVKTSITKARKSLWFEKFLWFISSENYLVIAGRDAQQNEMIVKRYMKSGDVYVHADLHGATTVVIKNYDPLQPIPPKTLTEAGDMAICYSAAWDAKIITSAWWVHPNQVSKQAPSGEYLSVGSFMIRGKKNYLSLSHLVMGFGFVFKLDDDSIERHRDDRKKRTVSGSESLPESEKTSESQTTEDVEIEISSESEDEEGAQFPDTKLPVQVQNPGSEGQSDDEEPVIVNSQKPRVKKQVNIQKAKKDAKKENNINKQQQDKPKHLKRGQKSKLKKIKEKYKDQDEEERQLRMSILGHKEKTEEGEEGNEGQLEKDEISEKLGEVSLKNDETQQKKNKEGDRINKLKIQNDSKNEIEATDDIEAEEGESTTNISDEVKILDSLTGNPLTEDTILYAIPVCAPYSAMQNYKYKVKVLPGMSRRGKAAKTALQLFIRDKLATDREKDVLKAIKDQEIGRNLPNKIKIATNLSVKGKK